jgi:uncharacterized UBP type Zn finger protein
MVGGLTNLGNTCFAAAFLQLLRASPQFRAAAAAASPRPYSLGSLLLKLFDAQARPPLSLAATALGDVCCAQDTGADTTTVLMMTLILSLPEDLQHGAQHDTTELARFLFTKTGLGDAAQILLQQKMTCSGCDCVSVKPDLQQAIELRLLTDDDSTVGLPELLDRFLAPEIISGYACNRPCGTEQNATMRLSLASISGTVILFINRNTYNAVTKENEKLMQPVHCPATLRLVVDGEAIELTLDATTYHRGAKVGSGHYFTIRWNPDGTATLFDDATVRSFTAAKARRFDAEHQVVSASYSIQAPASELDGLRLHQTTYAPVPPAGTTPVRRIHVRNRVQRHECCDGGELYVRVAAEAEAEAEAGAAEAEADEAGADEV